MRALGIVLLAVLLAGCATTPLQPASKFHRLPGLNLDPSIKQEALTLDALPLAVRTAAEAQLRERAGNLLPQMTFTGAERSIADGKPPEYVVEFAFSDATAGIASYHTEVRLSAAGDVLEGFDLPDFRKAPDKLRFVPIGEIEVVARREGIRFPRSVAYSTQLEYSPRNDAILWCFWQRRNKEGTSGVIDILWINAHTGEVAGRDTGQWFH